MTGESRALYLKIDALDLKIDSEEQLWRRC